MAFIEPRNVKGMRDFSSDDMLKRNYILKIFRENFEKYGFHPIETPSLEYIDILMGKYGEEGEKLIYKFKDYAERDLGLIYDLTVPLARYIAQNPGITLPFKRYQIQRVYRCEKPQKGRFREFYQCDIDIVGSESMLADAEVLILTCDILLQLGFKSFKIIINNRLILNDILNICNFSPDSYHSILRSIDKLDKLGKEYVQEELIRKVADNKKIGTLFNILYNTNSINDLNNINFSEKGKQGVKEVKEVIEYLKYYDFANFIEFNITLARGLDYYTRNIFEVLIEKPKIGSIVAGGRYDNLIGVFSNKNIPGVGLSFGFERIFYAMNELKMLEQEMNKQSFLITFFDTRYVEYMLKVAKILRDNNISCEIYYDNTRIGSQLRYADKLNIPYAIIIGENEIKNGTVSIKDMKKGLQEEIQISNLVNYIKNLKQD